MNLITPSVAIAIPTRNQSGFIVDTLRSAFNQSLSPVDVVVCDDAGTDDTLEVINRFRTELPPERRNLLRYVRNPERLGIGGNFDQAIRHARGDFVVKVDSDDILEEGFSEVLHDWLTNHPEAGWAHCNVLNIRPEGSSLGLAHSRKKAGYYAPGDALPAYLRHNDTCHCVMIRKDAYLEVGGYRPEMKTAEDWLLWLEMMMHGWGYCFDNRALARMRKYDQRRELMSLRRQDFLESIKFMHGHLENLGDTKNVNFGGLEFCEILDSFRATASRLCLTSAYHEADIHVRRALFEEACRYRSGWSIELQKRILGPLPASTTRKLHRVANWPRSCARVIIQRMRSFLR